jgi:TolB-like protein/Flp pilus assembly protein TadD/class 3 adenylate cyclase
VALFAGAEMPEGGANTKVEIAHVLTMDVIEYSKLLITEQTRVIAKLTNIVKSTERFHLAEAAGKLVRIPTGDGMALVFLDDPHAPIDCAVEIAMALKNHAEIRLRIGIHSGPVNQVVDVSGRPNVAGAGIDMAQRVMDCGDAGHILLSKRVADDLAPFPKWNPYLHELGECEVKHGRKISLVNFYTQEIGNPQRPKKCPAARSALRIAAAVGAGLLFVAFCLVWSLGKFHKQSSALLAPAKSIAVLPFENLSHDPDNAYFADGIQEEILTRLSKIAELKVISRTSTERYKSKPEDLSDIARQLGVAHILEGTVQKAADQVRVNVQLINARTDSHLWADQYDRKLTDIFAVETEIAAKIASTLQAKLTGREQRAIAVRPTGNTEAYQLYLKGRYLWSKRNAEDIQRAIDYFNQALSKDGNYARAYAGIADCYAVLPYFSHLNPKECEEKARLAADKALELDNDLAEAHASLGTLLMSEGKAAEAKREFVRAIDLDPNYANAFHWLGFIYFAPLGEFDSAITQVKRALELDPLSPAFNVHLGETYVWARRYPEAILQLRKTLELDDGSSYAHAVLGDALALSGQLDQAVTEYKKAYELDHDFHHLARLARAYVLNGERDEALRLLSQLKELERQGSVWHYDLALVYTVIGDKNQAIQRLEQSYKAREAGGIGRIKVDPMLDPLRGDPRFENLANQVYPKK